MLAEECELNPFLENKGIVVVGGAEEEHYNLLGEDRLRPISNVRPEGNEMCIRDSS